MPTAPGHFDAFDTTAEDWDSYISRFKFFLESSDIDAAAKKCTTFFQTIIDWLQEHIAPTPSIMVARHVFYMRNQATGESIKDYMTAFQHAARRCNFHNLEEVLRTWLVCGLREEQIQQQLIAMRDSAFKDALEEALSAEAADQFK